MIVNSVTSPSASYTIHVNVIAETCSNTMATMSVSAPSISDQTYLIRSDQSSLQISDFTVRNVAVCTSNDFSYSMSVNPPTSFITFDATSLTVFLISSDDNDAGSYDVTITGTI
jgi:hypothetical protein